MSSLGGPTFKKNWWIGVRQSCLHETGAQWLDYNTCTKKYYLVVNYTMEKKLNKKFKFKELCLSVVCKQVRPFDNEVVYINWNYYNVIIIKQLHRHLFNKLNFEVCKKLWLNYFENTLFKQLQENKNIFFYQFQITTN